MRRVSWRSFISFCLFFSFIIIIVSGLLLFLAPPGRVARWVNWEFWGVSLNNWQAIHTIFSYVFIIMGVFHIFTINRAAFAAYFIDKASNKIKRKKELIISFLLMVVIFIGTISNVIPFKPVINFGNYLSDSWKKKYNPPPVPHTENYTLVQITEEIIGIPTKEAIKKLKMKGIYVNDTNQTLMEISKNNNSSPLELYLIITDKIVDN